MSIANAPLPLPVRLMNAGFSITGPLGARLLSLRPEALIAHAAKQAGLNDFGSDYFRGPLARLCRSLEEDAQLTALGRLMARQDILRLLVNRLQFIDIFKRHPEIAEQEIEAPIFILGMPRTGTTSLHELMALGPAIPCTPELGGSLPIPSTGDSELSQRSTYSPMRGGAGPGRPVAARLPQHAPHGCRAATGVCGPLCLRFCLDDFRCAV